MTAAKNDETFDLSAFEAAETGTLDVIGLNEEPLLHAGKPVRITVYGPGSTQFVRADAKAAAANQARALAQLRGKHSKDPDEHRLQVADRLAAVTQNIENFPIPGGAHALYANPRLGYITNQVVKFLDDWGNFKPASAAT